MVVAHADVDNDLVSYASHDVPVYVDQESVDIADTGQKFLIDETEASIMKLPIDQRNAAWCALSPILGDFSRNEASFRALEQLYTRDTARFHGLEGVNDGGVALAWFNCYDNARAARERKAITRDLIINAALSFPRSYSSPIEIASIASGSARVVMEAMVALKELPIIARMLDWDEEAREYSRALARTYCLSDSIEVLAGDVLRVKRSLAGRPLHIAEAVGIVDYLDDRLAVFLLSQIRELLVNGGCLISSNILPNPHSEFVHSAIGWRPMHYRTESDFADLLVSAGFHPTSCEIHKGPLGVFMVSRSIKTLPY